MPIASIRFGMRALAVLLIVGCMDEPNPPLIPTSCASRNFFESNIGYRLDILFVIDDSHPMSSYQSALAANAQVFINILQSLSPLPDLHLAVARGSGGSLVDPVGCGALAGSTFLAWSHSGIVQNFSGTLADAFTCMTRVGTGGARQQVLGSGVTALSQTAGFVRDNAVLCVILIAAQDDGSPDEPTNYFLAFQRLKSAPRQVLASAITQPSAPRLQSFIDAFQSLGTMVSIDQQSWANAFAIIANRIGAQLGRQCIDGVPLQPISCTFDVVQNIGTDSQTQAGTLPTCNPAGQPSGACAALIHDSYCELSQTRIAICWNGFDPSMPSNPCPDGPDDPPTGSTVSIDCAVECH